MELRQIADPDAARAGMAVHQDELQARRVSVIPGFVSSDAIERMVTECDALAPDAYHQNVEGTPYLELPDDH